jgi:hypothetical protein
MPQPTPQYPHTVATFAVEAMPPSRLDCPGGSAKLHGGAGVFRCSSLRLRADQLGLSAVAAPR